MFRLAMVRRGMLGIGAALIAVAGARALTSAGASMDARSGSTVAVVAGENEYGNVASQMSRKS